MTQIKLINLGGGVFEVSGDGGFETTTFSGFDAFFITPPDGVPIRVADRQAPLSTVVRQDDMLTVASDAHHNSILVFENQHGLFVNCGARPAIGPQGVGTGQIDTVKGRNLVTARYAVRTKDLRNARVEVNIPPRRAELVDQLFQRWTETSPFRNTSLTNVAVAK